MTLIAADIGLIAERTSEKLYWKLQKVKPAWVSQNKAWKMYGGKTAITSLLKTVKSGFANRQIGMNTMCRTWRSSVHLQDISFP